MKFVCRSEEKKRPKKAGRLAPTLPSGIWTNQKRRGRGELNFFGRGGFCIHCVSARKEIQLSFPVHTAASYGVSNFLHVSIWSEG